jgi:hypothetical protein
LKIVFGPGAQPSQSEPIASPISKVCYRSFARRRHLSQPANRQPLRRYRGAQRRPWRR